MEALFDLSVFAVIAICVGGAIAIVRRTRQRRAAWESGLTARARVVRAWVTTQMVNNVARRVQWHEYDYTTHAGAAVRFKESGGPNGRAVGEEVLVYYAPDAPDRATASEPQPGKDTAAMIFWLVILLGAAAYALHFWATMPDL
ncbi:MULTISPECIES: hypothetical protein [unclassified Streptomyces]|uniref:hypothetical protein n=1 Tax=unclassified Streptomyces TaxID=2593676 RepID=UPI003D74B5A9